MKVNKDFTLGSYFGVFGFVMGVFGVSELSSTGFLDISAFGGGLKR
jgi:hypothetical protein